jgi:pSer/pThr/pTyr-binding forkhead associated (FHA) protein
MALIKIRWEVEEQTQTVTRSLDEALVVGRERGCDVIIPHQTVSRQHLQIAPRGSGLHLKNLSSTNPVRINSQQILNAGEETTTGDSVAIQIGLVNMQVSLSDLDDRIKFKIRCTHCGRVSDNTLTDCPWCGTSLAFGETYIPAGGEE